MYYMYEGEPVEVLEQTTREYEVYRYKGRPKHAWVPRYKDGVEIPLIPVMEDIVEEDADNLDFTYWKTNPYQHQKDFLKYAEKHAQMLLLDEPGLGKTKQSLDLIANRIRANQIKKALIVVGVSSLQYNWLNEVKKHTDLQGYILGTRPAGKSGLRTKIGSGKDKVDDVNRMAKMSAQVFITNVESLRNDSIITALLSQVNDKVLGMIVVDEVHKCKNAKTKQTKGLLSLDTHYKLGLTGTPIVNSPVDLFAMMQWLGRTVPPKTYFEAKYCVKGGFKDKETIGFKNTEDLSADLSYWTLRRTKAECLDLPEKTVQTIHFDMLPEQAKLYKEVQKDLRERSAEILAAASPMGQLMGLKKVTGCPPRVLETYPPEACAKLEALIDIVEEITASGQKIVIFCYHVFTLEYLNWALRKHGYNPALVYGAIGTQVREANVQAFQNIPECNIILGNYQTLGTGFNLTASSTIVEYELPWTAADETQAQDRCHRIGQHHPVNIIRLVTNRTYDEVNEEIVDSKELLAESIINADQNYQQRIASKILNMI